MTSTDKIATPPTTTTARPAKSSRTAPGKKVIPKAASKTTVKAKLVAKPVVPKAATKPAARPVTAKAPKAKKPKMVRDSFTIPKPEYDVLGVLKLRAAKLGNPVKKTEVIRAGIKAIAALSDAAFKQALLAVPSLKTGRPSKA